MDKQGSEKDISLTRGEYRSFKLNGGEIMGRKPKIGQHNEHELIEMLERGVRIPDIAKHFDCSASAVKRAMKKLDQKLPMIRQTMSPEQFKAQELLVQTKIRAEVAAILQESLVSLVGTKLTVNDVKKLGDLYHKLWTIDRVENDLSTENVAVAKKIYHELDEETKKYIDKLEDKIYEGEKQDADRRYEQEKEDGGMF
jgi:DNA-binding MarR family transcriptional regulator